MKTICAVFLLACIGCTAPRKTMVGEDTISRFPKAGQELSCEKWVRGKTQEWGYYNCGWVDATAKEYGVRLKESTVMRHGSEWTQTVAIPSCRADQNMEVIYPQPFNGTITIECNEMRGK